MLIYPFHNDDTQSQLHTGLASKGVADRRAKQGRDRHFWVWVFVLRFRDRYFWVWVFVLRYFKGTNGSGERKKRKEKQFLPLLKNKKTIKNGKDRHILFYCTCST